VTSEVVSVFEAAHFGVLPDAKRIRSSEESFKTRAQIIGTSNINGHSVLIGELVNTGNRLQEQHEIPAKGKPFVGHVVRIPGPS
jgi:hypothetical protein